MDDTQDLAIDFCPGCDPQDLSEHRPDGRVWNIRWHEMCAPSIQGSADEGVGPQTYLSGASESEGHTNRLVQALIR